MNSTEPLPSGLSASLPMLAAYLRYPAFTWSWFVRRGWLFWPIALAMAASFGAWHASSMATWDEFWPLAWRASAAYLVVMTAAPLLGTLVRRAGLDWRLERMGVVGAFVLGVVIARLAADWAGDYHGYLMGDHDMGAADEFPGFNGLLSETLGQAPDWIVLALLGGGLELISYLGERRRLEAQAQGLALAAARRERDEADLRLSVLQAQIEPHFLFNTLASVRSLVRSDPGQAAATVDALCHYLRATLPKLRTGAAAEPSTLGEQVDIAAGYLELMAIRVGGRMCVRIEVPDALRALAFPPLILLTLVENAVKHGVEPAAGRVTVVVSARVEGGVLTVRVDDDGAGLSPGAGSGVGLANVRAQLRSRFGDSASLNLTGAPGKGAVAAVAMLAQVE
jgi:signal transduction histidine kinase